MTISQDSSVFLNESNSYLIDCHACGAAYDALQAPWCQCIVKERTLLCSRCGQCFCRADVHTRAASGPAPPMLYGSVNSAARACRRCCRTIRGPRRP